MPIPETTSAESFERFVGGKVLRVGEGKAWREIKAWITSLPRVVDSLPFHRLFKSAVGEAPSRCHINLRMHEAKRLMRETKQSIVAVALDVGYTNPSHFAQIFRRETGPSPSDYRRQR